MTDFYQYIYNEVKFKRLEKTDAIDLIRQFETRIASNQASFLHPLLHQNISDLSEQRFSSTFTGEEFFLSSHRVKGRRILPGAAGLEMARAAIEMAAGTLAEGWTGLQLKHVIWERPVSVGEQPVRLYTGLFPESGAGNDEIAYEIYSAPEGSGKAKEDYPQYITHGRGSGLFTSVTDIPALDLQSIQAQCTQKVMYSSEIYETFAVMGIEYGPGYRGIEKVYVGPNQVLAKLALPASVPDTNGRFVLHPSMMVSALQASISLWADTVHHHEPALAFEIEELDVFGKCVPAMWALIRYSEHMPQGGGMLPKVDIDLCDEQGVVWVRIKGYSPRVLEESSETGMEPLEGTILLTPVWERIPDEKEPAVEHAHSTEPMAIIGGTKANWDAVKPFYPNARILEIQSHDTVQGIMNKVEAFGAIDQILWIAPESPARSMTDEALIADQNPGVLQVFRIIKALLSLGYGARNLGWTIITTGAQAIRKNEAINPTHASLYGLAGSMAKEFPNWKVRTVDLEAGLVDQDWPMAAIFNLPGDPQGDHWVNREQHWYRQQLLPIQHPPMDRTLYRNQGVYVVIGGAGGIGEAWSEYMIRTYQARIVWIGRRPMDAAIQSKLDRLGSLGAAPEYIAADATDGQALEQAYEVIRKRYSRIHGVIHSAIVLLDRSLQNMKEERFRAGLSAKVDVSVRLAQVFHREPLDFVLFFSAMQSFVKAPGQSNYAAGCVFKDAFAHQLANEWPCAVKIVNWGYWGSVGIVASENYQNRMTKVGVGSIEPPEAMETLEKLLAGSMDQIALVKTTQPLEGINPDGEWVTVHPRELPSCVQNLENQIPIPAGFTNVPAATIGQDLLAKVEADLIQIAARLLKAGMESIDSGAELFEYGFDPVLLAQFTDELNRKYRLELMPSIFSEYPSLNGLAVYLADSYPDKLAKWFPIEASLTPEKSETGTPVNEMEVLLGRLLWSQLQSIGMFQKKQAVRVELIKDSGLADLYHRWLDESLAVLTRQNYLQFDDKSYIVTEPARVDISAAWQEWDQKKVDWLNDPDMKAQAVLVETTLRALPEILTGKVRATDIIFPNSSMELVEGVYRQNILADVFNEVVANAVIAYLKERLEQDSSVRIRIIEIGAGTGGTSTMVFRKLAPYQAHIEEYCYTDISKAFLIHAEKEYGSWNPYLTYQLFNVENPVAGQGIAMGKYDLAIAANVLHATQNIRQTIRNAKAVLKSNGLLLLNELNGNSLFTHLTFGLLEGWWRYEDPELRIPGCPGLFPETWQAVLESEGFGSVFFPAREVHQFGQQIIVAESNGVIRQKRTCAARKRTIENRAIENREVASKQRDKIPQPRVEGANITGRMAVEYVKETIIAKLSESLKVAVAIIDVDASFADYGVDSITGVHLIQIINQSLNVQLTTTNLFDYSSVNQLTQYILSQYQDKIMAALEQNAPQTGSCPESISSQEDPVDKSPERYPNRKILSRLNLREPFTREANAVGSLRKGPIAIIGMSGRFAKSKTVDELWEHLAAGRDLTGEVTRWDLAKYYSNEKNYCKHGSFLDDIDQFDPLFFNISGIEAAYMDPCQRLFLEESWKALEDAGYAGTVGGKLCGVYLGYNGGDYHQLLAGNPNPPPQMMWGNADSIIPARIAYYLNLQGPAITVDTACSSSLVAIHLACQGLWAGETELALAGGVSVYCTPGFYLAAGRAGMLSPTGHCYTFDDRADGFIPGEGIGLVVLKRLPEAIAGGDHIYGVIRGSGINQDGTTNGITAPSANSQERLERYVYDTFHIDPEQIRMVEAHGTGTKLGDPIEYDALTRAFRNYTGKKEYCAIGSIKTNLGHTTAAAGVAGLIKILLSLKHKKIPPSLHFQSGNSHIEFKDSPFYVSTRLEDWDVAPNSKRQAAISAFGFSGTNAHMVIEEVPREERRHPEKFAHTRMRAGYLMVLSARTSEQLKQQAGQLAAYCEREPGADCGDVSFTLLLGRKHFNHRLACVVRSLRELADLLTKWLGRGNVSQVYTSELHENDHREQPSLKKYGNECIQNCGKITRAADYLEQLAMIADLYTQGYSLEFDQLFAGEQYNRISLPTYPFASDSYWIPEHRAPEIGIDSATPRIHPLLHQNTSNFIEQRFSSIFTGREFFLAGGVINGHRLFPGSAMLEMARAAVEAATANIQTGIRLQNMEWIRPLVIADSPLRLHIGLHPEENETIAYEIYRTPSGELEADVEPVIYHQGYAVLTPIPELQNLDLPALQEECGQKILSAPEVYEALRAMGVECEPGQQGIETVYVGHSQILAKLALPAAVSGTLDPFVLHPVILESLFQASAAFMASSGNCRPVFPFRLQALDVLGKCTPTMWALIRYYQVTEKATKLDMALCDDQGTATARLTGMEMKPVPETVNQNIPQHDSVPESQENYELMTFEEVWEEQSLPDDCLSGINPMNPKILICFLSDPENQQALVDTIQTHYPQTEIVFVSQSTSYQKPDRQKYGVVRNDRNSFLEAFRNIGAETGGLEVDAVLYLWPLENSSYIQDYSCLVYMLQAMAAAKLKVKRVLFSAQFAGGLDRCYLESWIGFERSLGLILPGTQVAAVHQEVAPDRKSNVKDWLPMLLAELRTPQAQSALYRDGKRYVCQIRPTVIPPDNHPVQSGGTYLVTGGCGGLGFLFARHLVKRWGGTVPVNLILTGRSSIVPAKQSKIAALEACGGRVMYIQADICDRAAMKAGLDQARQRFGVIHGAIHAAGIEGAQPIFGKDIQEFHAVLDPKVNGTLVLDELLQSDPLDFICYFSSSAAILGDFGSCDYAVANRFLMAYGHYRNERRRNGERRGKAIVINWPLWKDGGMGFGDDENTKMYLKSSGQRVLETGEGLALFDRIMAQNNPQHLILAGDPNRIHRFLGLPGGQSSQSLPDAFSLSSVAQPHNSQPPRGATHGRGRRPEMKGLSLEQCLEWDLKAQISQLIGISRDKLERRENLADFGFDSISLAGLAQRLSDYYGIEVTPALFFGYSTIEKLIQYFVTEQQAVVQEFYREDAGVVACPVQATSTKIPAVSDQFRQWPRKSRFIPGNVNSNIPEPIAIVGMSGRFPEARNIHELWMILATGRDVVKEIPPERFDWRKYDTGGRKIPWKCGCIPGVSEFEPLFFEISPKEAETMDPRQRLLLQESWRALEDAGYGAKQLKNHKIGMFVGAEQGDYQYLVKEAGSITSNNNAILAARLAYFLNLNGPVMAIDTACSSGLVAAHQAILSLRAGECDAAIAAGVNLLLTPVPYLGMSQAGMLSNDGKCYAFDKRADGMVPGEAVAVVILKRLSRAETDGDPIYAVIKGSGINYDGKTNGITAPSGVSQASLLKTVYDQYRVNPEEIEYIVTHGTGTRLGDPVEINALNDAFKDYICAGARKEGYRALTSTKTNFGHAFAASGLVSLISLVQALRHATIPASLHCEQENDYINWKESPFYVNKTNKPWLAGNEKPRMGAVSAFGMSGTNAHMIVQSYDPVPTGVSGNQPPYYLFVFSAKTEESLAEKIRDMVEALQNKDIQTQELSQISYTLLEGRRHFEHRCAVVIQNREDAVYVLQQASGREKLPNLFLGKVPRDFTGQKAIEKYAQDLLNMSLTLWENKPKYQETLLVLADLYCQGYEPDWKPLYGDHTPQRVHLPAYPFVRENYWISEPQGASVETALEWAKGHMTLQTQIHPLLQQNTSDLSEQRFSSTFTGQEFFLRDHIINGQRILPGVASLEMARAAVTQAISGLGENQVRIKLQNVIWARPIVIGDYPVRIHIGLYPEKNASNQAGALWEGESSIGYEIYSLPLSDAPPGESGNFEKDDLEPVVYSRGSAIIGPITEAPVLDLNQILARCDQGIVSAPEIYEAFKAMGINYGLGFQGIETVYVGSGQILAKLFLPSVLSNSKDPFVLHPSMMDSSLQASLGFIIAAGDGKRSGNKPLLKPALPFALEELEVLGQCTSTMWALIRYSTAPDGRVTNESGKLQKLDIDLCDEQGIISVRMKGYTSRVFDVSSQHDLTSKVVLTSKLGSSEKPDQSGVPGEEADLTRGQALIGTLILEPVWKERKVVPEIPAPNYGRQLVILCEMNEILPESIETQMNGVRCLSLQSKKRGIDKRFETYATEVFEVIQNLLKEKTVSKTLIQVVIPSQNEQQPFTGLSGLLKTAQLENPKLIGQIIEIDPTGDCEGIIAILRANAHVGGGRYPSENRIRYQNGKRMVAGWSKAAVAPEGISLVKAGIPWKDRGVYLITGGAGGLGLIFANEIADKAKEAAIVLTGRSPLDSIKQTRLRELEFKGITVKYRQVDVTDKKAITGLIQSIEEEFGSLHGVVHGAGVIKDNYIIKKTGNEFLEVLAPKVTGLVNLDEACKDLPLDFFILFSSVAGSFGNPGQADYSAANAFLDAYAGYRNGLVALNQRQGRTLSVNWPLWREGGMRVDRETETIMLQNTGLIAMGTQTGIQALYQGIASGKDQWMVLEGNLQQLRYALIEQPLSIQSGETPSGDDDQAKPVTSVPMLYEGEDSLREKTANYLKQLLSSVIKLPSHRIEADAPMEKYGIDSIMVMQLTNQLEKTFGSLSKTLFFEYQTIRELTGYFLEAYRDQLTHILGIQAKPATTIDNDPVVQFQPVISATRAHRHSRFGAIRTQAPEEKTAEVRDIAIIGVSGRYPGARNIQEFWNNLKNGKDCITEIPKDRWDHSLYFDGDKNKPGKTYSKWGGFLEGVDQFDPLFFNISPREAEFMDPQERIFLECVYETLEDAGYSRNLDIYQGFGNVGVYVGVMYEEYQLYGAQEQILGRPVALTGNPSSIANRISYFYNFRGPSMAVDTMCSSSLTAIHLACQSLRHSGCELALAGGVNISIHPNKYLMLAQGKFASSKGWCESFGEGGDGYVPGEGVGAVLLKPLDKAIADGDHIYGVIKGAAVNHGGKTNGYSVPNPNAQSGVISQALKEAGIDPRTISYIEAHGTGTSLGDPIEITGLTKAFREYTKDNQFCAIGSAKSNIGHCESAAGIAGVTKVLLQLQHGQLVPSIHSETLNPNIDFINSPFVVQQSLAEWERPVVNGLELPRRAGISSFGAGGSNAHIVIEEFRPQDREQPGLPATQGRTVREYAVLKRAVLKHAIIVLSAKNEERLREQVERLLAAIGERRFSDAQLADMAYTLQTGREAMEERLALIVVTIQELEEKLRRFAEGQADIENMYRGQAKGNLEPLQVFTADEEMREAVEKWIERKKYGKLMELWVKGLVFDWNKLYGDIKPHRISLPTYPFAREKYWLPEINAKFGMITRPVNTTAIHPLLQQNTSDIDGLCFSSIFTGEEFFLKDHVVKGWRIMPGVAYLEMVRAAVEQIISHARERDRINSLTGIRLRNVVWIRPIMVTDQPVRVHIGLYPGNGVLSQNGALEEGQDGIDYEIYGEPVNGIEPVVYSQGNVILTSITEIPGLDLGMIKAQCDQSALSTAKIYEAFKTIGIEYGPGHQGIEEIYAGKDQVLAKLSLPVSVSDTENQYILHPSLMDAALQAISGLVSAGMNPMENTAKPSLPFALQELDILGQCVPDMWAWIRAGNMNKSGDNSGVHPRMRSLDIDLCDEQGLIQVRIKGVSLRELDLSREPDLSGGLDLSSDLASINLNESEAPVIPGTLMLEPVWREPMIGRESSIPDYTRHFVILCEINEVSAETIETQMNQVRCLVFQSKRQGVDKRFSDYALRIFGLIQEILNDKSAGKALVQVGVAGQGERQLFSGFSGLLKTAWLENPKFTGQLIEVEPGEEPAGIIAKLKENSRFPGDQWIRYQDGKRKVAGWSEVEAFRPETGLPWKDGGIYLITGGAGGLGLIFAGEIARQAKGAALILTGRHPAPGGEKQAKLAELEAMGAKVIYRQVDVTQKKAVFELLDTIRGEFGRLDGIIHSAGIIKDNFIMKKTNDEFLEVMAPKVAGLVNLDHASREMDLDFFVFFSSLSGVFGNPGQADYAAANSFMDAYAGFRNNLVAVNQRRGRTLSINWPLWKEGGMSIGREAEKRMTENSGLIAMGTDTGILAFYRSLASGKNQVMAVEGNLNRLRAGFLEQPQPMEGMTSPSADGKDKPIPAIEPDLLREKAVNYFKMLLSSVLKLPANRIEPDAPLEKYGIDSVMVMELTNELEKTFGSLSKTLFFEYQTIGELTGYFLKSYPRQLTELLGIEAKAAAAADSNSIAGTVKLPFANRRRSGFGSFNPGIQPKKETTALDIAIIGVSGRYPQADNIQEFWNNLQNGKDCITEIPKDRWDHSRYFDEDKDKPGKTCSKWGGFLDGVDQFDPVFFNISPMEAGFTDPQERLFLECVCETLGDAGYTRHSLSERQASEGNIGVYVGVMYEEYQLYGAQEQVQGWPVALTGIPSSIANRVSYFCNFHGPSLAVDTMCSSSLMAIHLACHSLQRGECGMAIAGGVNLSIHPNKYLLLAQSKFLSNKGRCMSFGEGGDGYVPGEGVGAVLLKPLSKAIAGGDHIYGVIKGTAVNHGGKTNGYIVPNPNAQARVIGQALMEAGIDPRTISCVEAHGIGTSLGDPIEITGLTKAFREYTEDNQFCAIGSAKSNIGHCESAGGIAGITKVLLQLKYRHLAPSLHSKILNPNINFVNTPFVVQQALADWNRPVINGIESPRRAGVNSFGAGGSNAYVVIEEYIPQSQERIPLTIAPQNPDRPTGAIIVLSAGDEERLAAYARNILDFLEDGTKVDPGAFPGIEDIAYTLQVGREAMEERLAMVVPDTAGFIEKLTQYLQNKEHIEHLYYGKISGQKTRPELLSGRSGDEFVKLMIQEKEFSKLAQLWVFGEEIDWNLLYPNQKPRRVSIPVSPFAKKRCWIPKFETNNEGGEVSE